MAGLLLLVYLEPANSWWWRGGDLSYFVLQVRLFIGTRQNTRLAQGNKVGR